MPQLFDALPPHIEDALRASIQRFGVLVPVYVDQHGETIDGYHRKAIADQLGVGYDRIVRHCADDEERHALAHTLNADRRQLSGDDLRAAVVHLAEWRDRHGIGLSNVVIGETLHVDDNTVQRALSTCPPGQVDRPERVRGKDGKARPAKRQVFARDDREQKRAQEALPNVPDGQRTLDLKRAERRAREADAERRRTGPVEARTANSLVDIRHGDFREVLVDLESGSVDAIITDPPYPGEFLPLWADLGALARRVLAPHGVLVAMCGQYYLREYMAALSHDLRYRWTAAYLTPGPRTRVHRAGVGTGWKPLLVFTRYDATETLFLTDDVFDAAAGTSDGVDKEFHHWGQSELGIAEQVERFTRPGQLVVDPFLGGGTTALVCRDGGRRFIGCDEDAAAVATARERVA